MDTKSIISRFKEAYGTQPELYFAPGRVNFIGGHTDYNGGFVLPCAVSFGTYLAIAPNNDNVFRFETTNFEYKAVVKKEEIHIKQDNEWINYPLGVINQFVAAGIDFGHGIDMLFSGDFPEGSGLSSSASIELVTAFAFNEIYKAGFSKIDLIKMSHKAESEFVGVTSGIMDQYAAGIGESDSVILLNCHTQEYQLVPIDLKDHSIIIMNTNRNDEHAKEKCRQRLDECKQALEQLKTIKPGIKNLSDISPAEFEKLGSVIKDPVIFRRARHVVSENNRVLLAVDALKKNDLIAFGQLMNDSHESLRHDFQATGIELNTIVNAARKVKGIIGASVTGTGFGGCAIALTEKRYVEAVINKVGPAYEKEIGIKPMFYITNINNGAGKVELLK